MHTLVGFLAAHLQFFAGLAAGAILSPLLILALLRALDFIAPTPMPGHAPSAPIPRQGERRAYRPHRGHAHSTADSTADTRRGRQ